jgi:hypothetical protein
MLIGFAEPERKYAKLMSTTKMLPNVMLLMGCGIVVESPSKSGACSE